MRTPLITCLLHTSAWLLLAVVSINSAVAADVTDNNEQMKKNLKELHKAGQSGLSQILKTFSAEGGKFTLQDDGAIRIIPTNTSLVKKLLGTKTENQGSTTSDKALDDSPSLDDINVALIKRLQEANDNGLADLLTQLAPEGGHFELQEDGSIKVTPTDSAKAKALLSINADTSGGQQTQASDAATSTGTTKNIQSRESTSEASVLSDDNKELIKRLQEANNNGLSNLLNKLATDGGTFELIEDGGIKIIPNNSKKAKELLDITIKAQKVVEDKGLTELSFDSGIKPPVNSWTKAKNLTAAWITQQDLDGVYVGKIREIKWIYLVSIVNKKNNTMHTQLVIRKVDGKAVSINPDEFQLFNLSSN